MRKIKIRISICILSVVLIIALLPIFTGATETGGLSDYGVTVYTRNNGIQTGEANAVVQTYDGYIWIGGYGGLLCYDGYNFTQFSGTDKGLTSFSIRSLWVSDEGILWVGTNDQGAFYYSKGKFIKVTGSDSTVCLSVRCFCNDSYDTVWVGSADGLFYIENGILTQFDLQKFGVKPSTVYTMSYKNGYIWGVDNNGAVFGIDTLTRKLSKYYLPGELWDSELYAYSAYADNYYLYVGTSKNYVVRINLIYKTAETIPTGELSAINSICRTDSGDIWLCGDNGIGRITGGEFTDLSYLEGTEKLTNIIEDYENNIWVASSKYGVLHIVKNKVKTLVADTDMEQAEIYAVKRIGKNIYVGSEHGLTILDEKYQPIENGLTKVLSGTAVHHIACDNEGNVYIATYFKGLYIYNPVSEAYQSKETNGNRIRMILLLKDETVAVATNKGVDIFKNGDMISSYSDFAPTGAVLCLTQTNDGTLLCGSDGGGVYAVKDGKITQYAGINNGLSGGVILRVTNDSVNSDYVWISCGNDVFYGNKNGFIQIPELTAGSGSVLDIFTYGDYVWLFRSSEVLKLRRDTLLSGEKTVAPEEVFGAGEGLPGTVVANSFSSFDSEMIIICTNNGIGILQNSSVYRSYVIPKAAVSSIALSDGTKWNGERTVYLDKNLTKVSISVAALTFMKSDAQIQYKLDGVDGEYVTRSIGEQHEIEYTNLAAGTYDFHLYVINRDGVRSIEYVITFIKAPRFTETGWFPAVIVLTTAAVTFVIVVIITKTRIKQLREKQKFYQTITGQSIETIAGAIDAKDPYTNGHSRRVSEFSVKLAEKMNLSEKDCERLAYIALLHDLGKIGIPDEILKKTSKLTDEEFAVIKRHPVIGAEILHNFTALKGVEEGAAYHHERYDGKGYCAGLSGEDIPLFARIIGIADAYDAMSSDRCYRKAMSTDFILSELENGKGKQFDPVIAQYAIEIIEEEQKNKQV